MARKAIYESDAKLILSKELPKYLGRSKFDYPNKIIVITPETDLESLPDKYPWLKTDKLACKPDQLMGKRGKHNLVLLNADFNGLKSFIKENMNKELVINETKGVLNRFLCEPFVPHDKEFYVSITSDRENDIVHFSEQGGIFIEENWDKVTHIPIPLGESISDIDFISQLPIKDQNLMNVIEPFIKALLQLYIEMDFTFIELNPFAIKPENMAVVPLDVKARLDDTATFLHIDGWANPNNPIEFPPSFGSKIAPEEAFIADLDSQTGASLKLTILNRKGRIWTMVAGGGASVIYADTVVDMGYGHELGNYGEYSGNPNKEHTQLYAETVIDLMTAESDPEGRPKIFIIGGGIANFTDVKATFSGIVAALRKKVDKLKVANTKIFVRRGGPNEIEGLKMIKQVGEELGLHLEVYDRNTHMTRIVPMALGISEES